MVVKEFFRMATFLLIYFIYLTATDGSPVPQLTQPGQYIPAGSPNIPIIQQRGLLNNPNIDFVASPDGGYDARPLAGYCPVIICGSGCHQNSETCRCICSIDQFRPEVPNNNVPINYGGGGYMPIPEPFIFPSVNFKPVDLMIPSGNYGQQPQDQIGDSIKVKIRVNSQGEQPLQLGSIFRGGNQPLVNVLPLPSNAADMTGNQIRISVPFSSMKLL